jgi:hypothetical protein
MVPPSLTAVPLFSSLKETSLNGLPQCEGFCQNHCAKHICVTSKKQNKPCNNFFITPPLLKIKKLSKGLMHQATINFRFLIISAAASS